MSSDDSIIPRKGKMRRTLEGMKKHAQPKSDIVSDELITILSHKNMRRDFRLARERMELDIHAHKQALKKAITQLHTHLDALGYQRPAAPPASWIREAIGRPQAVVVGLDTLPLVLGGSAPMSRELRHECKKNKSATIKRWVESQNAANVASDPRIAYPDPEGDSEAETVWNQRVCYTDLSPACSRPEWVSWVSEVWSNYSLLKKDELEMKKTHKNINSSYNSLVSKGVLNDSTLTPGKYTVKFNKTQLAEIDAEMRICRQLRSRYHELLPTFENVI
ncbi:hypothetical protein EV426DRAFT_712578 [Tirmania nivea]|nr:hypothetical protein EV426DRAFT_712578 [Tirmania nivea]